MVVSVNSISTFILLGHMLTRTRRSCVPVWVQADEDCTVAWREPPLMNGASGRNWRLTRVFRPFLNEGAGDRDFSCPNAALLGETFTSRLRDFTQFLAVFRVRDRVDHAHDIIKRF
jgi:hypothetical protein